MTHDIIIDMTKNNSRNWYLKMPGSIRRVYDYIWWHWVPGDSFTVRWPFGMVVVDETDSRWDWTMSATQQSFESGDPNDHYRPELESRVGQQGIHWNWALLDNNSAENRLTIRICRSRSSAITYFALMWG